ncbi:MAG: hypothetical protein AAF711_05760 [Planctomycetota bacterium]
MICFLVCGRFRYTLDDYLTGWASHLADRIRILHYEELGRQSDWPPGAYVFTDIERLIRPELRAARHLAERFERYPEQYHVLNDPRRVLRRFSMLRKLYRKGINTFNVHRTDAPLDQIRFPVFIKREHEHSIKGIGLLHNADDLKQALRRLGPIDRLRKHRLMITEYCDIADEQGQFRKYAAMRLGEHVVPRHILLSNRWLTKKPDLITPELCEKEANFVASAQVHAGVADAFELAGIDYGRIDYGLLDGKVQVWEINTNPRLVPTRERLAVQRMDAQAASAEQINAALSELAGRRQGEAITIDPQMLGLWRGPLLRLAYWFYTGHVRS